MHVHTQFVVLCNHAKGIWEEREVVVGRKGVMEKEALMGREVVMGKEDVVGRQRWRRWWREGGGGMAGMRKEEVVGSGRRGAMTTQISVGNWQEMGLAEGKRDGLGSSAERQILGWRRVHAVCKQNNVVLSSNISLALSQYLA